MRLRVVVIGATGQLAHDILREWGATAPDLDVVGLSHDEIDVADEVDARACLERVAPSLVINTAAFHRVDLVEKDPRTALAVNTIGARIVAQICADLDADYIYISTDYVFSGQQTKPYCESDAVAPVNVYGVSKAAGEMLVRLACRRHYIVRSSGLYGLAGSSGKGGNFVDLMLRLAREGRSIRVVDDQRLTPTPTAALASQLLVLWRTGVYGTYHATCQGNCTWYEFAVEIFRQAGVYATVTPQTTAESGAWAMRPTYSVLGNYQLRSIGADVLPAWQDGLAAYLASRPST